MFNTKVLDLAEIKLTTPGSAIRLATNCATGPSVFTERNYYLVLASVIQLLFRGVHLPHSEMRNKYRGTFQILNEPRHEISNNLTF